ncbi:MAG TPA: DUF2207 domain-containing protein [Alphaproteobacteria bacterium]|nr:DUF2207 domain-containing protein [Alphaproteobacteria bacterium]HOO50349.1 DUF2207 domain-containing protein [Alphaproteobacteria bacterium]
MPGKARAQERILSFDVQADIYRNGDVYIREDIRVISEHNQIKRGIYRDLPDKYEDKLGNVVRTPLDIISISRDGQIEDYHTARMSNGVRIYIGNKNVIIPEGEHLYSIKYRVERAVGFFDDIDEFYWNVTGNGWGFPIEFASVDVTFPEEVQIKQSIAYTGAKGSVGTNYSVEMSDNKFHAQTVDTLPASHGLTIAVGIEKGGLIAPTQWDRVTFFFQDNLAWMIFGAGTILLFLYLLNMWQKYGDDTPGTIIPRFDIPEDISPSFLRYVWKQGTDRTAYTAELIQTALKGYIKISEDQEFTTLKKIKDTNNTSDSYARIFDPVFSNGTFVDLPKTGFGTSERQKALEVSRNFRESANMLDRLLENRQELFFSLNGAIKRNAIILALATLGLVLWLGQTEEQKALLAILTFAVHTGIIVAFWAPMKKYTNEGQRIADYAEGLRLYLSVAEKARLNALFPEDITPEIFERFLPYALALEVEQKWCNHFSEEIKKVAAHLPEHDREPYRARQMHHINNSLQFASIGALSSNLGSMTSRISSASTPPSTSSGSSGSGFSGGGGGGGGGGGW